jgi:hypothetical protein
LIRPRSAERCSSNSSLWLFVGKTLGGAPDLCGLDCFGVIFDGFSGGRLIDVRIASKAPKPCLAAVALRQWSSAGPNPERAMFLGRN